MTNGTSGIYKIVSIWPGKVTDGVGSEFRTVVDFGQARFYAIRVGEVGRGRTQRFIPIVNLPAPEKANLREFNFYFVRLRQGRSGWIGEAINQPVSPVGSLVLLDTSGGFRGYTNLPTVVGSAQVIETGWYAQGLAGRAGHHPALMILAIGPARIEWTRLGRLYGGEPDWVAWSHDGLTWYCLPRGDYLAACDVEAIPDVVMRLGQQEEQA